jgi:putative nucleotidyltransferase with HDIG domain
MQINRDQAFQLLCEWVKSESLRKHMFAVEAAMRAYAKKLGGDEEVWGICGLLHDLDYEKYPIIDSVGQTGHPFEGVKFLKEQGYPEEIITAILGHATYSNTPRISNMAKALYAVDELCGFVMACAYVRPTKLEGMEPSSVKKKLKTKEFAAKISREDIEKGIAELGVDKDEHIKTVILALQGKSKDLEFN